MTRKRKSLIDNKDNADMSDKDKKTTPSSSTQSVVINNEYTIQHRVANFRFPEFSPESEEWRYYIQRFQLELSLQGLADQAEPKRNLLLKFIGAERYRLVSDHFDPTSVTDITYNDIVSFLNSFYRPTTNYLAERVKFGQTYRKDEQTVTQFIGELRAKAVLCKFGSTLNERLRDQFLVGLKNPAMQEDLFSRHPEEKAEFNDIEKSALLLESAQQQRSAVTANGKSETTRNDINKVSKFKTKPFSRPKEKAEKQPDKSTVIDAAKQCIYCGRDRHAKDVKCPAANATCLHCGKSGHWKQACLSRVKLINFKQRRTVKAVSANSTESATLYQLNDGSILKATVNVVLNKTPVTMEYDSAAHRSTINKTIWQELGCPKLRSTVKLDAYNQQTIKTLGELDVTVKVGVKIRHAVVIVIDDSVVAPLFGLDWMQIFNMLPNNENVELSVNAVQIKPGDYEKKIFDEFKLLFKDEIGHVKNFKATFHVRDDAKPVLARARPVPFAQIQEVNDELDRMLKDDIIEPVDPTQGPIEWASPIVISERKNGCIRVVPDYKSTLNPNVIYEPYPLPSFEDAAAKLAGSTVFSIIDLKDAFLQVEVAEAFRKYLVIITHRGYFKFKRLPLGLTVSPLIFQKLMDSILADIGGVACCQDDIGIGGKNLKEHYQRLCAVLKRLQDLGMRTQRAKVKLFKDEIEYLGFKINGQGITPLADKVAAIKKLPQPTNQTELRSFIGTINQFSRFIPHLQQALSPLHPLTSKYAKWSWSAEHERVYENLKQLITSDSAVVHYQSDKPLFLTTDASEKGLGAVLQHCINGELRLIAAASRTLTPAEKNYSNIDREALAIIFGVGKFERYLRGRKFVIRIDQKLLERIFGEKVGIPKVAASRLVRWAIILSAFQYTIEYIPEKNNVIADVLSRLPLSEEKKSKLETMDEEQSASINTIQTRIYDNLVTQRVLKSKTLSDNILVKVIGYIQRGWPDKRQLPSEAFYTYFEKRDELYIEEGILMWHDRVVIPTDLRNIILLKLHETHMGSTAMKGLARTHVWWPKCDKEIEQYAAQCKTCRKFAPNEPDTPLCLWNTPQKPWQRIHIDYTGPYNNKYWLVAIDAYSRWLEIFPVASQTSSNTIKALRTLMSRYGLCESIVSDNGTAFTSEEFRSFCKSNNIKLICTTPYHSRSNGRVERAIRTFKWRYTKSFDQFQDEDHRLQAMLFAYRTSVHNVTGKTPAELFLGRSIRTSLDTLKPHYSNQEDVNTTKEKARYDGNKEEKHFEVGDQVWYKRGKETSWKPATIMKKNGVLSYEAKNDENVEVRVHADHLRGQRTRRSPKKLQDYVSK